MGLSGCRFLAAVNRDMPAKWPRSLTAEKLNKLIEIVGDTLEKVKIALEDGIYGLSPYADPNAFKKIRWDVEGVFEKYKTELLKLRTDLIEGGNADARLHAWGVSVRAVQLLAKFARIWEFDGNVKVRRKSLIQDLDDTIKEEARLSPEYVIDSWAVDRLKNLVGACLKQQLLNYDELVGVEQFEASLLFVTALDHEFQSMVRRLDKVHAITGERHFGCRQSIFLDEKAELKEFTFDGAFGRAGGRNHLGRPSSSDAGMQLEAQTGWAFGVMQGVQVAVVCVGVYGADTTSNSIDAFRKFRPGLEQPIRPLLPEVWCVVGVCGTTASRAVGIGELVLSKGVAFSLEKMPQHAAIQREVEQHSGIAEMVPLEAGGQGGNPWQFRECLPILDVADKVPESLQVDPSNLFVDIPEMSDSTVVVAKNEIRVHKRPFLCTNLVVKRTRDCELVQKALIEKLKELRSLPRYTASRYECCKNQLDAGGDEWYGIEMECPGLERHRAVIIKSIVDYADDDKGAGWGPELRLSIQLYGAEIAAEAAYRLAPDIAK